MRKAETFEIKRQRHALLSLLDPLFLQTAEGAAFMEQIEHHIAPHIIAQSISWGYPVDAQEVVNMVIVRLLENEHRLAVSIAGTAENPWAYLSTSALNWAAKDRGHRCTSIDIVDYALHMQQDEDSYLTLIEEMVPLAFQELAPYTPTHLHEDLRELLGWLAANPPQRASYEKGDRVAAHRHCRNFTYRQVEAVAKIAWGSRPNKIETSIFGQFLINPNFEIRDSYTHMAAILRYGDRMRAYDGVFDQIISSLDDEDTA